MVSQSSSDGSAQTPACVSPKSSQPPSYSLAAPGGRGYGERAGSHCAWRSRPTSRRGGTRCQAAPRPPADPATAGVSSGQRGNRVRGGESCAQRGPPRAAYEANIEAAVRLAPRHVLVLELALRVLTVLGPYASWRQYVTLGRAREEGGGVSLSLLVLRTIRQYVQKSQRVFSSLVAALKLYIMEMLGLFAWSSPASSSSTECPAFARLAASGAPPGPEPTIYASCLSTWPRIDLEKERDTYNVVILACFIPGRRARHGQRDGCEHTEEHVGCRMYLENFAAATVQSGTRCGGQVVANKAEYIHRTIPILEEQGWFPMAPSPVARDNISFLIQPHRPSPT